MGGRVNICRHAVRVTLTYIGPPQLFDSGTGTAPLCYAGNIEQDKYKGIALAEPGFLSAHYGASQLQLDLPRMRSPGERAHARALPVPVVISSWCRELFTRAPGKCERD